MKQTIAGKMIIMYYEVHVQFTHTHTHSDNT